MATLQHAVVNAATGNTVLVAAVAGTVVKLVNYVIVGDPASTIEFRTGVTTPLSGIMSLAANGGISAPASRTDYLLETVKGESLTLQVAGASSDVQGHIAYIRTVV